jgi:hypothetical protein
MLSVDIFFQLNSFTLPGTGPVGNTNHGSLKCRFLNNCPIFMKLVMNNMPIKVNKKTIIFSLSRSRIKTRWTWEIARWEDTTVAMNFQ